MDTPKRILIVDDEPHIVLLLRAYLERSGYEVEEAFSGNEAIERMTENVYDLVLLDFFLPDRIGVDICRNMRLHHKLKETPIIIVTGFSNREPADFLADGASDVLFKPVTQEDLIRKVQFYLPV